MGLFNRLVRTATGPVGMGVTALGTAGLYGYGAYNNHKRKEDIKNQREDATRRIDERRRSEDAIRRIDERRRQMEEEMVRKDEETRKELEKNINTNKPRTSIDKDLIGKMKSSVLDLDDDSSKGYATNDQTKASLGGDYKLSLNDFESEFKPDQRFGKNVYDFFEGKGLERVNIPGNDTINARLNQDAFRAEVLGGTDLAKKVVYWSGNNALHNRYAQMSDKEKTDLAYFLKKYNVTAPHRNSIAFGRTPGTNTPNSWFDEGRSTSDKVQPDITLARQFLQDGTLDASIGTRAAEGNLEGWNGIYEPYGDHKGGRHIPSVNVVGAGPDQNSTYSNVLDALSNYTTLTTQPYADDGDHYSIDGASYNNSGTQTFVRHYRNGWAHPGSFLHEVNHSESPIIGGTYDDTDETNSIGFSNPTAYAGRSIAETVRAIQSGKIPVTKMLIDKVGRLAPSIVPDYDKMSPEDQLDIKAQIIAQLAEDPEIALTTLKRWGAFNPDRPNREEGLEYYIPKSYLTDTSQLNNEIVNSLIGLNRSFVPEKNANPKWKQFWNLIYPQLIARNRNDRNNIV